MEQRKRVVQLRVPHHEILSNVVYEEIGERVLRPTRRLT
jgi:hypothetical protein